MRLQTLGKEGATEGFALYESSLCRMKSVIKSDALQNSLVALALFSPISVIAVPTLLLNS